MKEVELLKEKLDKQFMINEDLKKQISCLKLKLNNIPQFAEKM